MIIQNNSNISLYDDNQTDGPSLHKRLVFASAWILIAVAGILGNSLVIFVAIRFEKLNNVTNCFIVNLAITDIVFLAFCMPLLVVQYTLDHWYFNQTICKLINFLSYVSVLVTVLTLVVMTIDRYIYVAHPFENIKWRKPKTIFLLSLFIWLLSFILASPFYFHYGVITHEYQKQCALVTDENIQRQFGIYTVTLYYFIPLTIILICYTRLLYYVYSKEKKIQAKTKSNAVKWSKKRRAVTKMVAIVTLVFSVCWLPTTLYIMSANIFENRTAFLYYFKMIAHSFAYLNSAVNPIIYAFLNRSFRNNCGNILSEPAGSLCCRINYHARQQHISKQRNFNYESTERQNMNIDNNNIPISPNELSDNDFSDGEYELPDLECFAHMINDKTDHENNRIKQQLVTEKMINDRPLTTSL